MVRVRFYTRIGCHLCDEIWPFLQEQCAELGLPLESIDIDQDPKLVAKHGDWVPVVEIDSRDRLRGRIEPSLLKRELRIAAKGVILPSYRIGVAIVFDQSGRMLVNKRPEGSYYGGWWEWPGGKCELGESPLSAAKRELIEEIGIEADGWTLYRRQVSQYPGRVVKLNFFTATLKEGSLPHRDALEHRWLMPAEVLKLRFLEANHKVLESFESLREER